jgi:D-glycero-alpha-D-manno-heptose-7-phosphate kinase
VLIVRSPVRISFAGGGSDLPSYYEEYGGAVLSVALNKYFYTVLGKRTDGRVQVISSDLRIFETWRDISTKMISGSGLEIPLAVVKELGEEVAVDLFLASEIPPGTGLGSSASVCVNILKTLSTYLNRSLSKYELAERAFHIARNVLGRSVGKQDEYAASFGGLNFIEFHRDGSTEVEPIQMEEGVRREFETNLMLFFTGSAHHSWSILEDQEKSTRSRSGLTVEALHEVHSLTKPMRQALQTGNLSAVGRLLDQGWQAKKRVSGKISNSTIDRLYSLARQHGAVGGKITGAGGGGFLLLYCEPPQQAAVRGALHAEGIQEMAFSFDYQGAQVLVNDPFIDGDARTGSRWTFLPVSSSA